MLEKRAQRVPAFSTWIKPIMKAIKTYSTRVDADLAKIALDAAGVPSVVVGVGLAMEGGAGGVQLLVPEEYVDAALMVLEHS